MAQRGCSNVLAVRQGYSEVHLKGSVTSTFVYGFVFTCDEATRNFFPHLSISSWKHLEDREVIGLIGFKSEVRSDLQGHMEAGIGL